MIKQKRANFNRYSKILKIVMITIITNELQMNQIPISNNPLVVDMLFNG